MVCASTDPAFPNGNLGVAEFITIAKDTYPDCIIGRYGKYFCVWASEADRGNISLAIATLGVG